MDGEDFASLKRGLEDAIAYAQGDKTRGRVAKPLDVRAIRNATRKTQKQFADAYRLPIGTVRDWEQSRRQPDAPARVLLAMIAAEPETVERLIAKGEG